MFSRPAALRRLMLGIVVFGLAIVSPSTAAAQGGAVRGTVEDADGRAIKGAVVTALNPSGRPQRLSATTDEKGRFAMIGLVGGRWMFAAEAPGFAKQEGASFVRSTTTGNAPLQFVLNRVVAPTPSAVSRQIQNEIAAANEMRDAGRLDQALAAYQEIAEKNPILSMVKMVIADVQRRKAAAETAPAARAALYDSAVSTYQQVLTDEPNNESALVELGVTQLQKGDLAAAERTLVNGDAESASRELVFALAEVRLAKGDVIASERLFRRALALDEAWLRPKLKLGLIAYRKGDRVAASELFNAVVTADANSAEAAEAGRYLKELGK